MSSGSELTLKQEQLFIPFDAHLARFIHHFYSEIHSFTFLFSSLSILSLMSMMMINIHQLCFSWTRLKIKDWLYG